MNRSEQRLTKRMLDQIEHPKPDTKGKVKEIVLWDAEVRGFGVRIGKQTKSFFVQRQVRINGGIKTRQVKLGHFGVYTVEEARKLAAEQIKRFDEGLDLDPKAEAATRQATEKAERERGVTLKEAWEEYQVNAAVRGISARTIELYALHMRLYLAPWADRALRSITKVEVERRHHREIPQEIVAGKYALRVKAKRKPRYGPEGRARKPEGSVIARRDRTGKTTANQALRVFSVLYNEAARTRDDLPPNPCSVLKRRTHKTEKPRTAIPRDQLHSWWDGVSAIPNPIRRDYLRFVLLTGMRKSAAASLRWRDVDFEQRLFRVPKPKGGEKRAFAVPLSDYLLVLLKQRKAENPSLVAAQIIPKDSLEWVFPAFSNSGHIEEPREMIDSVPFKIHDLRHTFITLAESLDISPYAYKALVNHSQPKGDVTAGYIRLDVERLRAPMQKITEQFLAICGEREPGAVVPIRRNK